MVDRIFDFPFAEFVYIGRGEQLQEVAKCFAVLNKSEFGRPDARPMKFFNFVDLDTAIAYLEKNKKKSKLVFMDDIFIQGNKIKLKVANFINQAKNSKTTVVLTVHEPFGGEPEKTVRNAANWFGMFNLGSNAIARLTGYALSEDSPSMNEYKAREKYDKVLFFNTLEHIIFDNNYLPLESIKNE